MILVCLDLLLTLFQISLFGLILAFIFFVIFISLAAKLVGDNASGIGTDYIICPNDILALFLESIILCISALITLPIYLLIDGQYIAMSASFIFIIGTEVTLHEIFVSRLRLLKNELICSDLRFRDFCETVGILFSFGLSLGIFWNIMQRDLIKRARLIDSTISKISRDNKDVETKYKNLLDVLNIQRIAGTIDWEELGRHVEGSKKTKIFSGIASMVFITATIYLLCLLFMGKFNPLIDVIPEAFFVSSLVIMLFAFRLVISQQKKLQKFLSEKSVDLPEGRRLEFSLRVMDLLVSVFGWFKQTVGTELRMKIATIDTLTKIREEFEKMRGQPNNYALIYS